MLHVADFRKLVGASPLGKQRFSLVLCPFNAFQHLYDRADVEAFLEGIKARLAPGGRFVLDLMNPDLRWLSRDSTKRWARTRFKDPRTNTWMIYSTQIVYDSPLQIAFMTIFYERADGKGRTRRTLLTHRHFFPRELEALLHYNGLTIARREGDFDGRSLQPESEQQVLHCTLDPRRHPRRQISEKR
jgi:SAM-dependent methyltransferase